MRAFLETIGARGLITIIGMVIFLLAAAHFAYQRDNHEAAILWCLVLALLAVGGYLWWLLESTLHDAMDFAAHEGYAEGLIEAYDNHYLRGDHFIQSLRSNPYPCKETADE